MSDDPRALTDEEGEVIGYQCPSCGTLKTSAEKARQHCAARSKGGWESVDFESPESDVWPETLVSHRCWLTRKNGSKQPFAPWGERAHPDVDPAKDARFSWSIAENWTDKATADRWVEMDPRLEGYAVILDSEADPYSENPDPIALVDGDNVRDPETGAVHPGFIAILEQLGLTYADVSRSESGIHALYEGRLPEDVRRANFPIDDEPWGANDEPPGVEIYDGKRVCVVTGEHVPGTPEDVRPWHEDGLEAILDEHVPEEDRHSPVSHDTDADPLADYEPTVTEAHETTHEIEDVFYAIEHLTPTDLPLRTARVDTEAGKDGWEKWDPSSYRSSTGGDSLHRPPDESTFFDQKAEHTFGLLALFAAEQGVIQKPWHDLRGSDWWDAVEAARNAGAPIPEYERKEGSSSDFRSLLESQGEGVAIMPYSPRARAAANGWRWHTVGNEDAHSQASESAASAAQQELWDRTTDEIERVIDGRKSALIDVIMGGGKTYGSFKVAADRDENLAYFAGRTELYEQAKQYAIDNGIPESDILIMPSPFRDCPSFRGDHADAVEARVKALYQRGAHPKTIHSLLGEELPCKHDEKCKYELKCEFDPDEYQVLIGHYKHSYLPQATKGRVCIFDEDPANSFTSRIGGGVLKQAINTFLGFHDSPPFDGWLDLIENRHDTDRRDVGLEWFNAANGGQGFDLEEADERNVIDHEGEGYHAYAPHAVYAILQTSPMDDGEDTTYPFERAYLPKMGQEARFFTTSEQDGEEFVEFETPPDLGYAHSVLALDGTPLIDNDGHPAEWEKSLGRPLNHRRVLTDSERREHLRDRGFVFVQSSPYIRPYSSGRYNDAKRDAALCQAVKRSYGDSEAPLVFTDKKVEQEYRAAGFCERGIAKEFDHPGNLRGSNEYADERLLVHLGSSHHGDHELRRRAARLGATVPMNPEGKGTERDYGEVGNAIREQMSENQTAQNVLRVGRDGKGALVVLDTCAFPGWLPVEAEQIDVSLWSKGEQQVRQAWGDILDQAESEGVHSAKVAGHEVVSLTERHVNRILDGLAAKGHLRKEEDPEDGRRNVWIDAGLRQIGGSEAADVSVPEVDLDAVEAVRKERDETYRLGREAGGTRRWEKADNSRIQFYTRNVSTFGNAEAFSNTLAYAPSLTSFDGGDHGNPPPEEAD